MKTIETNGFSFGNHPVESDIRVPLIMRDGKIAQTTSNTSCRESLISYLSAFMSPQKVYKRPDLKKEQQEKFAWITKKARIIFTGRYKKDIKGVEKDGALNVLHMLEKDLGYPKTKCLQVIDNNPNSPTTKLMFEGSNKWLRSSHTLSLWIMLIRMGLRDPKFRVTTWEDLKKLVKRYPNSIGNHGHASHGRDRFYTKKTLKNWLPLMQNLDKIFPPSTPWLKRWNPQYALKSNTKSVYSGNLSSEGIYKLVDGKSKHRHAERFKKVMSQEK